MMRWQGRLEKPHPHSGDIMPQWIVTNDQIGRLLELSDDLEWDLEELNNDIMAISLDKVVKNNRSKKIGPRSVDCICHCDNTTYLIEFKAEKGGKDREEIMKKYPEKAIDSLILLYRFLETEKTEKVKLFIVHQNVRQGIVGDLSRRSGEYSIPSEISWLNMRDSENRGIYFDEVYYLPCEKFVELANKKLKNSSEEQLRSKFNINSTES